MPTDEQEAPDQRVMAFGGFLAFRGGAMTLDEQFGQFAEKLARFLGTPRFIVGQTVIVAVWVALNVVLVVGLQWDPYPFILLNLAFSTQAAYAAPLILLAQNRQADRDREKADQDLAADEEDLKVDQEQLVLLREVHAVVVKPTE